MVARASGQSCFIALALTESEPLCYAAAHAIGAGTDSGASAIPFLAFGMG